MSHRQIFTKIPGFNRVFVNMLNGHLAKYNLFSSQWAIIRLLKNHEPLSFQEIAKANYIEKPSASNLIHKLIANGYVETIEGSDKRTKLVRLTPQGNEVYDEIDKMIEKWTESIVEGIPEEHQTIVLQSLDIMMKNLRK